MNLNALAEESSYTQFVIGDCTYKYLGALGETFSEVRKVNYR